MRTIKHLRWYIVGFIFLATVVNYVDRMAFTQTAPIISNVIVAAFRTGERDEITGRAVTRVEGIINSGDPSQEELNRRLELLGLENKDDIRSKVESELDSLVRGAARPPAMRESPRVRVPAALLAAAKSEAEKQTRESLKDYGQKDIDALAARVAESIVVGNGPRRGPEMTAAVSAATREMVIQEQQILVAGAVRGAVDDYVKWLFSIVAMSFQVGYILGPTPLGVLLDRLGLRRGYPITMALWSAAGILTIMSVEIGGLLEKVFPLHILPVIVGFAICRFLLGFGEAGNWPAAIKSIGEWFPTRERSLAMGWFNSGSSVGAFLAPIIVYKLVHGGMWQPPFILVGLLGFAWIIGWLYLYYSPEKHPRLSKEELDYISQDRAKQDTEEERLPWYEGLKYRQVRGVLMSRFFSETVWWFCQTWLPLYFSTQRNVDFKSMTVFMVLTFFSSDIGNLVGGWLSSQFIKRGWTINKSRKAVMAPCGVLMFSAFFVPHVPVPAAVVILSIVTFCYQGWSVNMQTIPADVVPRRALGSAAGLAHMTAGLAGFTISLLTGSLNYNTVFAIIACNAAMAVVLLFAAIGRIDPERSEARAA